ncbi:MAG: HAD-IA family hydrolase [Actinocatenispora sp.]
MTGWTRTLRTPCAALLLDLDGVLRRFDPSHEARVTAAHDLPDGLLTRTAFEPDRLRPVLLGQVAHEAWTAGVLESVAATLDDRTRAEQAVRDWHAYRGEVVPEVLAAVREVRAAGVPVALGTNATDLLAADLDGLGLTGEVDVVVNSSEVGHAKPSKEFFVAACERLGVAPRLCLFVDDSERNIRGARAAGLAAVRYTGPEDMRYVRSMLAAA